MMLGASPHSSELTVKIVRHAMKNRLRPSTLASHPLMGSTIAAFYEFQPIFEIFISQRLAISPIARLIHSRDHGTHAVTIAGGNFRGVS